MNTGTCVQVTAIADGEVVVPTAKPPEQVVAVTHDGSREPVDWVTVAGGVRLTVSDAAGPVSHYELQLEPHPTGPQAE